MDERVKLFAASVAFYVLSLGILVLGLHIAGVVQIDHESINVGTNNSYCGFDWQHGNVYCEHAE